MSDGLKKGSADDPWADDEDDTEQVEERREAGAGGEQSGRDARKEPAATRGSGTASSSSEPYLQRRDGAKDERKLIQFFLREDVYGEMVESRVRAEVGEDLGELPGKFDLREALVAVGQEHVDEVVDELREMGY